jgi:hypothetical protein
VISAKTTIFADFGLSVKNQSQIRGLGTVNLASTENLLQLCRGECTVVLEGEDIWIEWR